MTGEILVSQLISMVNWNIRQNVTVNKIKSLNKIHMTLAKINTSDHDIFLFECLKHSLLYNSNRNYSEVCYNWTNWIHLSMKEGSLFVLFCFVPIRSTELGCFRSLSWSIWKALQEEGCIVLVSWRLDLRCRSSWILNDFFTEKTKLNRSWKIQRNWNVPLVLMEISWRAREQLLLSRS
jgi:hypothetical protein